MQAMILAGGFGTRISEESVVRPKPMVEIGGMPILWHIMKIYSYYGVNDFIICCGYKSHVIKEWFANYLHRSADVTFDFRNNETEIHSSPAEPWRVTLADTGEKTMTGGRIKRAAQYLTGDTFFLTYGDGVSDIDIGASLEFHRKHGKKATMTAVQPDQRFGVFPLAPGEELVSHFREKPKGDAVWVNAGFFVLDRSVVDYIDGDDTVWEVEPLQRLVDDQQLVANRHEGFWQPMDNLHDKNTLEGIWDTGEAPWKRTGTSPDIKQGPIAGKRLDKQGEDVLKVRPAS
ncbi:MAG: glucose-1-phosphate cytidylyltransferase [Pseudomonadota bacterium]